MKIINYEIQMICNESLEDEQEQLEDLHNCLKKNFKNTYKSIREI